MTDQICHVAGCARPVQDAYVCRHCSDQLTGDLRRIITGHQPPPPQEYVVDDRGRSVAVPRPAGWIGRDLSSPFDHNSGLIADLAASYSRETRTGRGGRGTETPLVWHEKAGELRMQLCATLVRYARLVAAARTITLPDDAEALTVATWLQRHVPWLRHQAAGATAVTEIHTAVRDIIRIIDPVADRAYVGPCTAAPLDAGACLCACHDATAKERPLCTVTDCADGTGHGEDLCGADLYAPERAPELLCRACHQRYQVKDRREWLLVAARDVLGTATEIARALTRLDQPCTPDRIWKWKQRGRLLQRGALSRGKRQEPLYRLGDVEELLVDAAALQARRGAREAG